VSDNCLQWGAGLGPVLRSLALMYYFLFYIVLYINENVYIFEVKVNVL
jgi:hypothetical protein